MNELPIDSRAQSYAILKLEAQAHATRSMIALLAAQNAAVLKGLKHYAGMVEDIGVGAMLTDDQVGQMRNEIESVLRPFSYFTMLWASTQTKNPTIRLVGARNHEGAHSSPGASSGRP